MSDHFIGLNRGQSGFAASDFTIGTSTGGTDVEVRVADAAHLTREDVVLLLDRIKEQFTMRGLSILLTNSPV